MLFYFVIFFFLQQYDRASESYPSLPRTSTLSSGKGGVLELCDPGLIIIGRWGKISTPPHLDWRIGARAAATTKTRAAWLARPGEGDEETDGWVNGEGDHWAGRVGTEGIAAA